MPETTCSETIIGEDSETRSDEESIEAFKERVAASTAHALHSGDGTVKSFFNMVGRIAREQWDEARSEYNDLKTRV